MGDVPQEPYLGAGCRSEVSALYLIIVGPHPLPFSLGLLMDGHICLTSLSLNLY